MNLTTSLCIQWTYSTCLGMLSEHPAMHSSCEAGLQQYAECLLLFDCLHGRLRVVMLLSAWSGIHVILACVDTPCLTAVTLAFWGKTEPVVPFPGGDKWFFSLTSALSVVSLAHWIQGLHGHKHALIHTQTHKKFVSLLCVHRFIFLCHFIWF